MLGPDGAPIAPPAHAAPIPLEQLHDAFVDALCTPMPDCCKVAGFEYVPGACAALLAQGDAGAGIGLVLAPAGAAGTTYDPQAAGDCLAFYKALATSANEICKAPVEAMAPGETEDEFTISQELRLKEISPAADVFTMAASACDKIFVGTKAIGAECNGPWECAQPPGVYESAGLFCKPSKLGDGNGPNVCVALVLTSEGQACNNDSNADDSRLCADKVDATDSKTVVHQLKGLYCDPTTKTCKRGHDAANGESCAADSGGICAETSYCNNDNSKCTALAANGTDCNNSDHCASNLCKDGTCADRAPPGSACVDREDCSTTYCGANKTCVQVTSGYARIQTCSGKNE